MKLLFYVFLIIGVNLTMVEEKLQYDLQLSPTSKRNLKQMPMHIGFDSSQFDTVLTNGIALKIKLLHLLEAAQLFFEDLLLVNNPQFRPISILIPNINCNGYVYTPLQLTDGFSGVDLQILVSVAIDSTQINPWKVQSQICQRDPTTQRPILGQLSIRISNITFSPTDYEFQLILKEIIHELANIIAFNSVSMQNFRDSKGVLYSTSMIDLSLFTLSFPNSLAWAQQYFNCSALTSIPIEITSPGQNVSWNRAILLDDIMSGLFILGQRVWSGLNNALLMDSGWYGVNLQMQDISLQWGKNKGCPFIESGCLQNGFKEFCTILGSIGLNYSENSIGVCSSLYSSDSFIYLNAGITFRNCKFFMPVQNRECRNPGNQLNPKNDIFVREFNYLFSAHSRAFQTTLTPYLYSSFDSVTCLQATCLTNSTTNNIYVIIQFGDSQQFSCTTNGQMLSISLPFLFSGIISCPSDITKFCNVSHGCDSFCSSRGYCLSGQCRCPSSVQNGSDCQCPLQMYYFQGICQTCDIGCLTCTPLDFTICLSCHDGYYLSQTKCLACDQSCLTCEASVSSPLSQVCLTCRYKQYLNNQQMCVDCLLNCDTCDKNGRCTKCSPGFGWDQKASACLIVCDYSCSECQSSPQICTKCNLPLIFNSSLNKCECPPGHFTLLNNQCNPCPNHCLQCTSQYDCQSCQIGYRLFPFSMTCQAYQTLLQFDLLFIFILIFVLFIA